MVLIHQLQDNDYVVGRGGTASYHNGNVAVRKAIDQFIVNKIEQLHHNKWNSITSNEVITYGLSLIEDYNLMTLKNGEYVSTELDHRKKRSLVQGLLHNNENYMHKKHTDNQLLDPWLTIYGFD